MQINTAILSFGMSGKLFHAPFIQVHPELNLYGVWERSRQLAHEIYPGIHSFPTLEDLLSDPAIELVVVNTPNYTHYEYTKKALLAGKHVVVEKPFTTSVEEGKELIELAKQQQKVLSVYQNRRFDSDFKIVRKVVEEGQLGNIVEVEMHYDRYREELSPKLHKETPGPGTGALYDLGSHLIDQALQLFGEPAAVFGDIRILRPLSKVDDYFELLLFYPDLRVRLHTSYLVKEPLPAYILHGTAGSFIKAKTDVQEQALMNGEKPGSEIWGAEPESEKGLLHIEKDGKDHKEYLTSANGNYLEYYNGIAMAIREHEKPPVTAEQGLAVIKIIEAAYKSSRERIVVDMDWK